MILNRQRTVRVARPPLEAFLARVGEQLRLNGAEITVCLVSDPAIARMNETFRHKKGPTDVLSFPAGDHSFASEQDHVGAQPRCAPSRQDRSASRLRHLARTKMSAAAGVGSREGTHSTSENQPLGDIAISPATARRSARKFGRTLPGELQILILHGVLHLLGYDHETDNGQMTRVENRLRRRLGLS